MPVHVILSSTSSPINEIFKNYCFECFICIEELEIGYSRVQKSIENFVFRPKMAIFQWAEMREGGLPLPLPFQYLILMI